MSPRPTSADVITLLGFGRVGSALAGLLLAAWPRPFHLNVVRREDHLGGSLLDWAHGTALREDCSLSMNSAALLAESRLVFHAAGSTQPLGVSRLVLARTNAAITRELLGGVAFPAPPWIVVITNPVDVIAHVAWRASRLDHRRVISVGTMLDTARLEWYLAAAQGTPVSSVSGWVLGEHGDSQVPVWSRSTCDGRPARDVASAEELEAVAHRTRQAAHTIRREAPGTWHAVAQCALELGLALTGEGTLARPVGVRPQGRWADTLGDDVFIGLPADIRADGVHQRAEFDMTDAETADLGASARVLRGALRDV